MSENRYDYFQQLDKSYWIIDTIINYRLAICYKEESAKLVTRLMNEGSKIETDISSYTLNPKQERNSDGRQTDPTTQRSQRSEASG